VKWIAAAIVLAALIVAGAIVLTRPSGPEVFETDSAIEALDYAESGWYCEWSDHGRYRPASGNVMQPGYEPVSGLEFFANAERALRETKGEKTVLNMDEERPDFRCTREAP
jgi:hypothetical protein